MPTKVSQKEIRIANKLASKSKLTQKDVDEFSEKIKTSANKRFLKK